MSGYVRIHRSLIGHPAFRNDAEAMAFAWMVMKAAWKPARVRYKGHDITLQRGQLTISIRDFAEAQDRPKGWAERLFARLREHGMIEQKSGTGVGTRVGTHGGTDGGTPANVVTICNYDDYQACSGERETPAETPGKTEARQPQDTEQVREEGKKEVGSRKRARTPDFEIEDWIPAGPIAAFIEVRKAKGKPLDSYTAKQLFGRLRSIRDAGWNLEDVINKAVIGRHDGFWMPDGRDQNIRRAETGKELTPAEHRKRAEFFASIGQDEKAREHLRKAEMGVAGAMRSSVAADDNRKFATGPPGQPLANVTGEVLRRAAGG